MKQRKSFRFFIPLWVIAAAITTFYFYHVGWNPKPFSLGGLFTAGLILMLDGLLSAGQIKKFEIGIGISAPTMVMLILNWQTAVAPL